MDNNQINSLCKLSMVRKKSIRNKINMIFEHNADKNISTVKIGKIRKLIEIIPATISHINENANNAYRESICKGCIRKFDRCYKLTRHLKTNKDCVILHVIDKAAMKNALNAIRGGVTIMN